MMNMLKPFRGTAVALLVFAGIAGVWWALQPVEETPKQRKERKNQQQGIALFAFEKSDLTKVTVERPDGTINLSERPDGWWIDGADGIADGTSPSGAGASDEPLPASRSMVNRVKHQLHDLVSRASVVEGTEDIALYGLGKSAIRVTLQMRDGTIHTFDAGDPNPSGVSFYIRPTPGDLVYTVKKSAVDYYSLSLSEFRERRFASFDSKDVDALDVVWGTAQQAQPAGRHLRFQRTGEHAWELLQPERFAASDDGVRGLMGRVSALKAVRFVTDKPTAEELASYGLDAPRLQIALTFQGKDPITLQVGADAPEKDGTYDLAYVRLAEDPSVYTARNGLLENYAKDPAEYRLMRFGRMDPNRVSLVVATFTAPPAGKDDPRDDDADLNGTVTVRMAADSWLWEDGVPVAGSTPKRVAQRAADVSADEFISNIPDDKKYGFDQPVVSMRLQDLDGTNRTLILGGKGAPSTDHDGHERDRYYARVSDYDEVYLVDSGVIEVVKDLMREHRRKMNGDDAKDERQERIEEERTAPVGPMAPGQPQRPGMPPRPEKPPRPEQSQPPTPGKKTP